MGHKNWAQQFHDALFEIGDGDGDGDEEAEPPSKMDYAIHIVSVPWKLLFAFVPPVDYCGGWLCFCCALVMIAGVTAIVGDMANLVGCCMDILPEDCAITFVALGTSLPDTFASMTAAKMDPYADASIGNVTGSNSVNVFLGVGIAWAMAAFKWSTGEITDDWIERVASLKSLLSKSEKENVASYMGCSIVDVTSTAYTSRNHTAADLAWFTKVSEWTCPGTTKGAGGHSFVLDSDCAGKTPSFVTPAGTLWFNLMVFSVNAGFAIQHLYARRRKFGGELGGPKKGMFGQYFSAGFLAFQWFIYVGLSIMFARVQGGMTYGDIATSNFGVKPTC